MSKQKGNHTALLNKARAYILEKIERDKLFYPYYNIVLRHEELQKKYKLTNAHAWHNFIEVLVQEGWIKYMPNAHYKRQELAMKFFLTPLFLSQNDLIPDSIIFNIVNHINNGYSIYNPINSYNNKTATVQQTEIKEELVDKVRFGKVCIPSIYSDREIDAVIGMKYPQYNYYQAKAAELNLGLIPQARITFEAKKELDKQGRIRNISVRAWNPIAIMMSNKHHPEQYEKTRDQTFDQIFNYDWVEYDIKGSVPRVSRAVNYGAIEDLSSDPYEVMYKRFCDSSSQWELFRPFFKQMFMRLYFGGSVDNIASKIKFSKGMEFNKELLAELKEATIDYCGQSEGNSIFLHESCIYMDVYEELLNRGITVFQAYDAFFMRTSELPKDIDDIVYRCMKNYIDKWIH